MRTPQTRRKQRRLRVLLLLLGVAVTVGGCGRKLPPSPPDLIPPAAVEDLSQEVQEGRAVLTWSLPQVQKNKFARAAGFKIFRARQDRAEAECSTCPLRFKLIGNLPVQTESPGSRMRFSEPLEAGFKYVYKVVGYSGENVSAKDSNVVSVDY